MNIAADLFAGYSASDFHLFASALAMNAGVASLAGYPPPAYDCAKFFRHRLGQSVALR